MTARRGTSERPDPPIALVIGGGGMGMSAARRLGQCRITATELLVDGGIVAATPTAPA